MPSNKLRLGLRPLISEQVSHGGYGKFAEGAN